MDFLFFFIAFFGGLLAFLSPCTFSILPAYFAYSAASTKASILKNTVGFSVGVVTVFISMGIFASTLGSFVTKNKSVFSLITAIVLIIFGLLMIFKKNMNFFKIDHKSKKGFFGSLVFGIIFSISWSGCVGPILGAILIIATSTSVFFGGLLLLIFSIGLVSPLIFFSLFLKNLNRDSRFWKFARGKLLHFSLFGKRHSVHSTMLISGILFILLGIIFLTSKGNFILLNPEFIQNGVFSLEEKLASIFYIN